MRAALNMLTCILVLIEFAILPEDYTVTELCYIEKASYIAATMFLL